MRTPVKNFLISAPGGFPVQKTAKSILFGGCLCAGTAQTGQFRAMGIISRAAGHPKDVPFVREFWWGTYGLAAISP